MVVKLTEYDSMASEYEVHDFLWGLIRLMHPQLVVETGCYHGVATKRIGEAVKLNGSGRLISCDVEGPMVARARANCEGLPVEIRQRAALDIPELSEADLIFSDSSEESRQAEYYAAKPGCIFLMHDTIGTHVLRDFMKAKGAILFPAGRGIGLLIK